MNSKALNREVLRLAIPSILANITIPLVGIVDVAIIGHISNAAAVGGIAVGTMLFDLLYWNFGFLRAGTSGMTAQAFGRGDKHGQAKLLKQGLAISAMAAAAIWLIQWLFVTAVLWLMPCSEEVATFARHYFFVRIWAAPATLALMALKGWFIGMQNTVAPMTTDIVVNVVNMIASYALAVHTHLGAIGVAWGTLIAQYSGLLTGLCILAMRYKSMWSLASMRESMRWKEMKRLFVLNGNLFLRSLSFMIIYVGYTALMSRYGDTELAVSAILMKIFMVFSYFIDGYAYAAEALVGREGTRDGGEWQKNRAVKDCVRVLLWWSLGLGTAFTLIYALFSEQMIALMTNESTIQTAAQPYYIYLWMMPLISSLAFLWDGVFFGATQTGPVRNCMFWAAGLFVASYLAGAPILGAEAIYIAYIIHLLTRTVHLTISWQRL